MAKEYPWTQADETPELDDAANRAGEDEADKAWRVEVTDEGDCFIRIPDHDLCFGDLETTDGCCFEIAQLISAAPELLEACKEALIALTVKHAKEYGKGTFEERREWAEQYPTGTMKTLRAAISKARGEK